MRTILLPLCLVSLAAAAQQTIHSTSSGSASNPLIWDCFCFPTPDDIVFVDHHVTMNVDWAITSGGRIEVSVGASLVQDADRQLLVDGTGSELRVYGTAGFTDIAFTNGAGGLNSGQLGVDRGLYFGPGTSFTNSAAINGVDSLLTAGTFTNSGNFYAGNFLNTGTFSNTGHIGADSMGNTGTFDALGGYIDVGTFGNAGMFHMQNAGFMNVSGNWYNAEDFIVDSGLELFVGGNAYNGDTVGGTYVTVNGLMAVYGDFANSDAVNGDGNICVGQTSSNSGLVSGGLDFCDNTGGDFDINVGSIGPNVIYCFPGCHLELGEQQLASASLYPNPATTLLQIDSDQLFEQAFFYSTAGELVTVFSIQGNTIATNGLNAGMYFVKLAGEKDSQLLKVVIE